MQAPGSRAGGERRRSMRCSCGGPGSPPLARIGRAVACGRRPRGVPAAGPRLRGPRAGRRRLWEVAAAGT
uniref:Uncharacterized protein n=1 Tax=Arundo donax TaxID=35708 RepID=A0A0A9ALP0_ARUDO